jgi:type IV secretory pathway VirB4 component
MMGGDYLDIMDGLEVNPLTLPDDAESRAFLSNWFQVLTGKTDDAALLAIDSAIRQNFLLDRKDRSLPNIAEAFGLPGEGTIRASLQRWITGQFATFFTADRDAMDFTRQIVGIDMTTLLDLPEVLAPLSYYLFHKLLIQARGKGGYAVFVDELPRYLANTAFAPKIDMMLQELRKTDGVFIGAAQSIDSVINSPSADKFLTNIETYLLFPEPRARREHFLGDGLRLNDQEYLWLTQTHRPREVLVKRKSGESTVLNVDLSPLGEFLQVFNSSADAVAELNQLRRERHDWQAAYLRGN